jgi:hypothetical protein
MMIAAIYARKSTDQGGVADEQKSVGRQVDHARAYAMAKGWRVDDARVYVDDGISGGEFAKTYRERLFLKANRVGGTAMAAYEVTCHLTGLYPHWWIGRRFTEAGDWWWPVAPRSRRATSCSSSSTAPGRRRGRG